MWQVEALNILAIRESGGGWGGANSHHSTKSAVFPAYSCSMVWGTEYIFYCKRAILFLSSSKILTPHPPLRPASLFSPRNKGGGCTLAGGEGDGGSIFWKTREIGLPSYNNGLSTVWGVKRVLLHNGGSWNAFTQKRQNMTQYIKFIFPFRAFNEEPLWKRSFYVTFVELK